MTRLSPAARIAVAAALAVPFAALAHTGGGVPHPHGDVAAFVAGFVHPFTGPDHLAAMVALGLWSGLTARRAWAAPAGFVLALLAGAGLGLAGVAVPAVEPMVATSLLVFGLLVATGRRLPAAAGAVLAAAFALFHGAAHGTELAGAGAAPALAGMAVATALLHAAGVAAGRRLQGVHPRWPRVAGTGVAVFGLALLAPLA